MKTLVYWRHSVKGTDNNSQIIVQNGLTQAQKAAAKLGELGYDFKHVFAGPLKRTWQTLLAIVCSIQNFYAKVYEEVKSIGDDEMFNGWKNAGVKFGGGKANFDAVRDGLPSETLNKACTNALDAVRDMLNVMAEGDQGLAVGHSPVIEMAAAAAGLDMTGVQLKENEFILFELDGDAITASLPS